MWENEAILKIGRLLRPIAQILAGARKDVSLFCVSPVSKLKSVLKHSSINVFIEEGRGRVFITHSSAMVGDPVAEKNVHVCMQNEPNRNLRAEQWNQYLLNAQASAL